MITEKTKIIEIKSQYAKVPPGFYPVKFIRKRKRDKHFNFEFEILSGPFKGKLLTKGIEIT